jgi:hypothetical protein
MGTSVSYFLRDPNQVTDHKFFIAAFEVINANLSNFIDTTLPKSVLLLGLLKNQSPLPPQFWRNIILDINQS